MYIFIILLLLLLLLISTDVKGYQQLLLLVGTDVNTYIRFFYFLVIDNFFILFHRTSICTGVIELKISN